MVIPAASRVCFTPSIANFASSSAVIPALPVFGSIPTCPPTYSTSPTRTPSLKGTPLNSAGRGKTRYFRSASAEIEHAVNRTKTARLAVRNFIRFSYHHLLAPSFSAKRKGTHRFAHTLAMFVISQNACTTSAERIVLRGYDFRLPRPRRHLVHRFFVLDHVPRRRPRPRSQARWRHNSLRRRPGFAQSDTSHPPFTGRTRPCPHHFLLCGALDDRLGQCSLRPVMAGAASSPRRMDGSGRTGRKLHARYPFGARHSCWHDRWCLRTSRFRRLHQRGRRHRAWYRRVRCYVPQHHLRSQSPARYF